MTYKRNERVEIGRGCSREIIAGPIAVPGDQWTLSSAAPDATWTVEVLSQKLDRYGQWSYVVRFPKGRVSTVSQTELGRRV